MGPESTLVYITGYNQFLDKVHHGAGRGDTSIHQRQDSDVLEVRHNLFLHSWRKIELFQVVPFGSFGSTIITGPSVDFSPGISGLSVGFPPGNTPGLNVCLK